MKGLSPRNLRYMREFARAWPADSAAEILQHVVARLPWGHHTVLLDKLGDQDACVWYATEAEQRGWSAEKSQPSTRTHNADRLAPAGCTCQ